jgi:hypothetical protein
MTGVDSRNFRGFLNCPKPIKLDDFVTVLLGTPEKAGFSRGGTLPSLRSGSGSGCEFPGNTTLAYASLQLQALRSGSGTVSRLGTFATMAEAVQTFGKKKVPILTLPF